MPSTPTCSTALPSQSQTASRKPEPLSPSLPSATFGVARQTLAAASFRRTLPSGERSRLSTSQVTISCRGSAFWIIRLKIETRKIASGKSEKSTR